MFFESLLGNFTSINDITFSAIERATVLFPTATFVLDRGYDDNKIFLKLEELKKQINDNLAA